MVTLLYNYEQQSSQQYQRTVTCSFGNDAHYPTVGIGLQHDAIPAPSLPLDDILMDGFAIIAFGFDPSSLLMTPK
jgi:hypothetical protein